MPIESQKEELMANGFRIFGPCASFSKDMEPEYVTIFANSRTEREVVRKTTPFPRLTCSVKRSPIFFRKI
ncbi:MAG: hypothetical protein MUE71_04485 [Chitinophagaceae bacterium]|nr:hypothetical protein [Chitinophagaceae bacterium]